MSSDAAVIQGPGFINIRGSSRMRMILILEMKSILSWDDGFPLRPPVGGQAITPT